jgi:hypothetical protein
MDRQRAYRDALERLTQNTRNRGAGTGDGYSNCPVIKFELKYGAHLHWGSSYDDGELNALLVETAINHINSKQKNIEQQLQKANDTLEGAIQWTTK